MRKKQYNRLPIQQWFGVRNQTGVLDTSFLVLTKLTFLINLPNTSATIYQYHQFIATACDNNQLSTVTLKYMQLTSRLFYWAQCIVDTLNTWVGLSTFRPRKRKKLKYFNFIFLPLKARSFPLVKNSKKSAFSENVPYQRKKRSVFRFPD